MSEKRKMAFYELQKGKLALEMQTAFEDAQKQTMIYSDVSKVTLELIVYPPENRQENYGRIQYKIKKSLPALKSKKMTTELSSLGLIVSDGTSVDDILQEELDFKEATIHNLKEVK